MYKIIDSTVFFRPCIICGEDFTIYDREMVCPECKAAVLKIREQRKKVGNNGTKNRDCV